MFHLANGIYFAPLDSGEVEIRVCTTADPQSEMVKEFVASPNEWASVVAAVCDRGESAETYREALSFHLSTERPWTPDKEPK